MALSCWRHPLARIGLLRTCSNARPGAVAGRARYVTSPTARSSWVQDVDDISNETARRRLSGQIHVLGVGNIGGFVAHSLASRPSRPPITLMLQSVDLYENFLKRKKQIAMNFNGLDDVKTGFDVNVLDGRTWFAPSSGEEIEDSSGHKIPQTPNLDLGSDKSDRELLPDDGEIECLILTVKAPMTVKALKSVKNRLTPDSTVLIIQNGMGSLDEVNKLVFPDPSTRPNYMIGVISHGVRYRAPFHVEHTGVGTTILSPISSRGGHRAAIDDESDWAPSTKYLLRILTLTPPLVAFAEPPSSLLLHQLEKLAMNCVINPLTAILDCTNGELLQDRHTSRMMRLLLIEISSVICALPELQGVPGIETRFSPDRLKALAESLAQRTADNHSSMLQDVRNGKGTEIDYMNGYIVRRGEELGIRCVLNYMVKQMVLARRSQLVMREETAVPLLDTIMAEDGI